ncbi:hypothetical protein COHA_008203 [Chlorella ohadii]|uniref:Coiled-coil domain-containing R3HCC1L n=1 Tax=Chlorella ohadii TaxID=2649997 RepID=A0AAD5DH96_9CHLO|nr:hypothetical protein COHA_008203 [Chlorella ohadii]
MGSASDDAAVLADLAQLKLDEGDAQGAQELFRRALEARQQQDEQQAAEDGGAAAAAADEADSWEAWDEDAVPLPQPPQPAPAAKGNGADSWEAAAAPPRPSTRSRPAAAPAAAVAAADGGEAAETLAFGGGHVLEFFDLTPAVRTQHLEAFLERLCSGHAAPPTLKWVDDCHAAVVCFDPRAAQQLLAAANAAGPAAEFRLRGYADAGSGTRKLPPSELLPPKPRPKTSAAVARRLIGGALNMRLRDKDAEQQLAATRRQQRQEREERQKALDAAWDD